MIRMIKKNIVTIHDKVFKKIRSINDVWYGIFVLFVAKLWCFFNIQNCTFRKKINYHSNYL